ncbi:MAG: glycosyltransferase [bacterium]|nr:glycosyltransferase [bacterium]
MVEAFHELYADAPIYTSYCSDDWRKRLDDKVITGYLQYPPFKQLRRFLPLLRQWWFARLDLSEFDLVISITGNGEAKFVRVPNGKHISYCHTPVHFYWRHYDEYVRNPSVRPKWLARFGLKSLVKPLRKRDYAAAQKVDHFIANSTHIQADISQFYGRDSTVIFPPVNIDEFSNHSTLNPQPSALSFVTHGRLVPYKKVDIIIEACNQLKLPLTVIGKGPDLPRLQNLAGPTISFKGFVSQADLPQLLAQHSAYIFAAYEDFGIAPVEAMASGLPVIAYQAGGAFDYVIPGRTGEFFAEQSAASLKAVLQTYDPKNYNANDLRQQASNFSKENFANKFREFISDLVS